MPADYTVWSIGDDAAHASRATALASVLPRAVIRRVDAAMLRRLPGGLALIASSVDDARAARASGFGGGIIVHGAVPAQADQESLRSIGATTVPDSAPPVDVAEAIAASIPASLGGSGAEIGEDLGRTRRLLAAGVIAQSLQHAFNNPLSALLAEAQLLQMEAKTEDVRRAADRMVELARRLSDLTRSLDGLRERSPGP